MAGSTGSEHRMGQERHIGVRLRLAPVWLIALAVGACAPQPAPSPAIEAPSPAPTSSPGGAPLPTPSPFVWAPDRSSQPEVGLYDLPTLSFLSTACAGIGLEGYRLAGDPSDPRVAWLASEAGRRRDVVFPPGFQARFEPALEILRPDGVVVAHEGDVVQWGCVTDEPGILLILAG